MRENTTPRPRRATLADAHAVSRLRCRVDPDDCLGAEALAHRWRLTDRFGGGERWVMERSGSVVASGSTYHARWGLDRPRFANLRVFGDPDLEAAMLAFLEGRAVAEGAAHLVLHLLEGQRGRIALAESRGYRLERAQRRWELELQPRTERFRAMLAPRRRELERQGIRLTTLDGASSPEELRSLLRTVVESEADIPTTVPIPEVTLEEVIARHDAPGVTRDRSWVALDSEGIGGVSMLEYAGPGAAAWTAYTGTARRLRGRGVAMALKLCTLVQAAELGVTSVRTQNDAANAPILHLNGKLGYRPIESQLEYLKDVAPAT